MAIGETSRPPNSDIDAAAMPGAAAERSGNATETAEVAFASVVEEEASAMTSVAGKPTMTGGGVFERRVNPHRRKGVGDQSFKTLSTVWKSKVDRDSQTTFNTLPYSIKVREGILNSAVDNKTAWLNSIVAGF